MPSFSSFNIANEQGCQQTRFVVTWQEGLYFAGQEKQSLMYFFLLLYICKPFFPLLQSVWKSHQRHQSLILQDCRWKSVSELIRKLVFARKLKMILFGLFSKLCVIEFTPNKTFFWSVYHLSSDMTSSNILFECSFKVFMKTDCVGVRSCWYIVKNWLKNSIFFVHKKQRGTLLLLLLLSFSSFAMAAEISLKFVASS